ncbi:MAG: helix-turn-helix domain-containing protein [Ethanoligenens sp.]
MLTNGIEVRTVGMAAFTERDAYRLMLRDYPDVMNVQQMCDVLHIGTKTGYRMILRQEIQVLKIGRSYRVPKRSILRHLTVRRQPPHVVQPIKGSIDKLDLIVCLYYDSSINGR